MQNKILKNASYVVSANILLHILGFIYHIIIVRILGPDKYGILSLANTIIDTITSLSLFGLAGGIVYFTSKYFNTGKYKNYIKKIQASFLICFGGSFIISILLLVFIKYYLVFFYNYPYLKQIMYILTISVLFRNLSILFTNIFKGAKKPKTDFTAKLIGDFFRISAIPLCLLFTNGNLYIMVSLLVISYLLPLPYFIIVFNKTIIPVKQLIKKIKLKSIKQTFNFSLPLAVNEYLFLISQRIDILFIGYFLSSQNVGIYKALLTLTIIVWFIPQGLQYLLFPELTEIYHNHKTKNYKFINFFNKNLNYIVYFNFPVIFFSIIFSKNILNLLYGYTFSLSSITFIILLSVFSVESISVPYTFILRSLAKNWLYLSISSINIIANVILNFLMIPKFGIKGAAIATLISCCIKFSICFISTGLFFKKIIFPKNLLLNVFLFLSLLFVYFLLNTILTLPYKTILFLIFLILHLLTGIFIFKKSIKIS